MIINAFQIPSRFLNECTSANNYLLFLTILDMLADLVHIARCVVDSDNTTYIVIAFSSCCKQKAPIGALSFCCPVANEARQTARSRSACCRYVANPSI
jgi:hypothetical protein